MSFRCGQFSSGSSPLTRGKRRVLSVWSVFQRLIPAHAGKTALMPWRTASVSAHPRSRGENARVREAGASASGSSPLTRGKRGACGWAAGRTRLIPAHAGKTAWRATAASPASAHPRSRGENYTLMSRVRVSTGSSPLTRGKHDEPHPRHRHLRLIPAHAGKTLSDQYVVPGQWAHPRSRGENADSRA